MAQTPAGGAAGRALGALVGLAACAALGACAAGPRAHADGPFAVTGQITDRVGALDGRGPAVRRALRRLSSAEDVRLFVVYVRDFSGREPAEWAAETVRLSGMGRRELLMAVATGTRRYHVSAHPDFALPAGDMGEVARVAVEPALRQNDWAGAAIGAADGYAAALAGRTIPRPRVTPGEADPRGGGGAGWLLSAGLIGAGLAGGVYLYACGRRRPAAGPAAAGPEPLPDLDARASLLLVQTDDAVTGSEQEVGFARAQFGAAAAAPFAEAVAFAREQLTVAFRLRQRLDDEVPRDDDARRRVLQEIVRRCAEAGRRLDARSDAFDRLRDLESNAPAVLAEVAARHRRVAAGVAAARDLVARMGRELAAPAVAAVADNPDQARDRLDLADRNLAEARAALDRGEPSRAAPAIRAAESAVDQAERLLAAVRRRSAELAAAAAGLRAVLDDTERDLAAARSLITAEQRWQAELAPHIARARSVMRQVRADLAAGPVDPIAEHQRLQEAHDALDEALSGVRGERERRRSAAVQLDQAILVARSEIAAARDLIATRCGAVGSTARTRLAEAERRLGRAVGLAGPDPVTALTAAEQAAALGQQAAQLAERDVRGHSLAGVPGGDGDLAGAGGFGGPATRVRRGRSFPAADRVTTDHGGFHP